SEQGSPVLVDGARRADAALGCGRPAPMSRALYIVGAPGTGKSTLMDRVVSGLRLTWEPDEKVWRELWVNPLTQDGERLGLSFGVKRPGFAGTDALSMTVQPRALEWLKQT